MATIVTLKSVNEGMYTVEIKREFDSSTQTREFTKDGLNEYVEGLKHYCQHKGYEFIYREELDSKTICPRCDSEDIWFVTDVFGEGKYECRDCHFSWGEDEF